VCFDDESCFVGVKKIKILTLKKLLPRRILNSHLSKYAIKYILSTHRKMFVNQLLSGKETLSISIDSVSIWEGRGNLNKKRETLAHF